jgi:hypothetical protein
MRLSPSIVAVVIVFAFILVQYPTFVFGMIDRLDIRIRQFIAWLLK